MAQAVRDVRDTEPVDLLSYQRTAQLPRRRWLYTQVSFLFILEVQLISSEQPMQLRSSKEPCLSDHASHRTSWHGDLGRYGAVQILRESH